MTLPKDRAADKKGEEFAREAWPPTRPTGAAPNAGIPPDADSVRPLKRDFESETTEGWNQGARDAAGMRKKRVATGSEAARRPLETLSSMNQSFRVFARTVHDVTEEQRRLKEEREKLLAREREARREADLARREMSGVLERIGDAFFAVDAEGCFSYVNRRAERLLGKPRDTLLGRSMVEELPWEKGTEPRRQILRAFREGLVTAFEAPSPDKRSWISARVYPSRDGLSVYLKDDTGRKRAEEERDRLMAKEWVAAAAAAERERISRELHDRVAHSMAVVHQSLELYEALQDADPIRAREKLEQAKKMSQVALDSTRNLSSELRRSEAESGLVVALEELLDAGSLPHLQTRLSVSGDEADLPPHVRGQVFLILREAFRNAVRHSSGDTVSVGLKVTPDEVSGSVEDDGRGMDGHDGENGPSGGGGVGLRSMKERAALLGGALSVDSTNPGGTKVEVRVPLGNGRR